MDNQELFGEQPSQEQNLSAYFDRILAGMEKHPSELMGVKIRGLSKLEELAANAPDKIPDWFDYFLEKPPMPEQPPGTDSLPENLRGVATQWLQRPEAHVLLHDDGDREILKAFQEKWMEHFVEEEMAQSHYDLCRYFLWRVTYARMMLHSLNECSRI